eukprot:8627621-Ditylum_brightwellii.AAC.1
MHQTIPYTAEEPTFESIRKVHNLLNRNAMGQLRGAYGNRLGLLGLTSTADAYRTLDGKDFVTPTPPTPPLLPPLASAHQMQEASRQYDEGMKRYNQYLLTAQALKKQLLSAFDNRYFQSLYDQATEYEDQTVLELLQRLYTNYGQ